MATIYDAILSLNNMGVYLEKTGGLGIRGYPPFKKLRALEELNGNNLCYFEPEEQGCIFRENRGVGGSFP